MLLFVFVDSISSIDRDSIELEKHFRTFHFNRPANNKKKKSLIFVLHGSGGNGKQMMAGASKLDKLSSNENFIVVYPDGYKRYTDPKDGKTIERYQFKEKGKPEVTLLKVIGGKHDYPGDIDVHVEAWDFFKRQ